MNTSNKRKSFIKRHLDLICINAAAIIFFIVASPRAEFSKANLIIGIFLFFFFINIRLIFNCFKILRSLDSIEKHDFDRSDNKKITIALSILASIMGLSVFLIIVKGMVWTGVALLLVSGCVFIYYEYTIRKAALRRKLERDGNEIASNDR
jgi:hypothetical protein